MFFIRKKELDMNPSAATACCLAPDMIIADMQPFSFSSEHMWQVWISAFPSQTLTVYFGVGFCQSQKHVRVFQKLVVIWWFRYYYYFFTASPKMSSSSPKVLHFLCSHGITAL